jgi:membrane-bound serine protease (ClpP class)
MAGYGIYNLPINIWAFVLLIVGVIPFLLALRKSRRIIFLIIAILSNLIGACFLFQGEQWWQPAVNPFLAVIVSALTGSYLWIAITKVLEVERKRPAHDTSALIGEIGEAKTDILDEGSVQIAGELWSARSKQVITQGSKVRVVNKEGFILIVEPDSGQVQV